MEAKKYMLRLTCFGSFTHSSRCLLMMYCKEGVTSRLTSCWQHLLGFIGFVPRIAHLQTNLCPPHWNWERVGLSIHYTLSDKLLNFGEAFRKWCTLPKGNATMCLRANLGQSFSSFIMVESFRNDQKNQTKRQRWLSFAWWLGSNIQKETALLLWVEEIQLRLSGGLHTSYWQIKQFPKLIIFLGHAALHYCSCFTSW